MVSKATNFNSAFENVLPEPLLLSDIREVDTTCTCKHKHMTL